MASFHKFCLLFIGLVKINPFAILVKLCLTGGHQGQFLFSRPPCMSRGVVSPYCWLVDQARFLPSSLLPPAFFRLVCVGRIRSQFSTGEVQLGRRGELRGESIYMRACQPGIP